MSVHGVPSSEVTNKEVIKTRWLLKPQGEGVKARFVIKKFQHVECEIHTPNYHNQSRQQQPPHKQTRKQELALAHHPAWVGHHTVGSPSKPTVHPCPLRWGGCGLLNNSTTHNNESKKTQHDNNMVAEQVLCDLSVRRASVCVHGVCRRS